MQFADEARLREVITTALEIEGDQYNNSLSLGDCALWDSLGHMNLIFAIEEAFSVRFDSTEIPDLKSVAKIKEALAKKVS